MPKLALVAILMTTVACRSQGGEQDRQSSFPIQYPAGDPGTEASGHPEAGSIFFNPRSCTGTVINACTIMTSAHCLDGRTAPSTWQAIFPYQPPPSNQVLNNLVSSVSDPDADLAMIYMSSPLTPATYGVLAPVGTLPNQSQITIVGSFRNASYITNKLWQRVSTLASTSDTAYATIPYFLDNGDSGGPWFGPAGSINAVSMGGLIPAGTTIAENEAARTDTRANQGWIVDNTLPYCSSKTCTTFAAAQGWNSYYCDTARSSYCQGTGATTYDCKRCCQCGGAGQLCCPVNEGFSNQGWTCGAVATGMQSNLACYHGYCSACGGLNQSCCNGSICNSGFTCSGGTCVPQYPICGGSGQPCCSQGQAQCNNSSMTCSYGNCVPCGGSGQVCCPANGPVPQCENGMSCTNGTCGTPACGSSGQPCCYPGPTCNGAGLLCVTYTCTPCGGAQQICCASNSCNQGFTCTNGTCNSCGSEGQACCGGSTCNSANLTCAGGACVQCGGSGQACCAGGLACTGTLVCRKGICQ
jgi:hypothetical protein